MDMKKRTRPPSTPGDVLKGLCLEPLGMTVNALAERIGVSRKALSSLINGHSAVSVDMAMRLGRVFSTSPEMWLNLQRNLDVWQATHSPGAWQNIKPIQEPFDILED
ncbi:MAG: HigA family addiction module antidote protein [Candidatus Adiutrix sp.]|jgi:addiction module HigA family antidote|nr:HigA family addiction module antidote protein [Candidatus Adiutrix sp.]